VPDPLGLAPEEMRRLAHRVVDLALDHVESLDEQPAIRAGDPAELTAALGGPLPEDPGDADTALDTLAYVALTHLQHPEHPRYFARIPSPASWAGVLGEWLGVAHNTIAASWAGAPGPVTVELVTLEWLREIVGMPAGSSGLFTSGGSLASLTALAAARAEHGAGVAYLSDQAHASVVRGLAALAFADVRILPADAAGRLAPSAVRAAVAEDRAAGRRPGFLVATAGTTNTGAVDPLADLADLADAEGLWFHVDGAYGAAAALSSRARHALAGMERADSLVLDPHKWLFQPYDAGCLLVRDPGVLERAFAMTPEYLADVAGSGQVNLRDRGLELTRRGRALKLWLTFRIHGAGALRAAVERGIELAEQAEALLRADDRWEVVSPAQLGIVCFALRGAGSEEHVARAAALAADGYAVVSTTALRGRTVLRLCTINPLTSEDDIAGTLARLGAQQRASARA
jgi:aromatic-L-amino-acid/L-tryptophan decarboxylase